MSESKMVRVVAFGLIALVGCVDHEDAHGAHDNPNSTDDTVPAEGAIDARTDDNPTDASESYVPAVESEEGDPPTAQQPPPTPQGKCPSKSYKSVVFVGDSITAGAGQAPAYRTLLVKNDDTRYASWKGADFQGCFGNDVTIVNVSRGGAVAAIPTNNNPSNMRVFINQVRAAPKTLPTPVLVVGTIGGNDAQLGMASYLSGGSTDGARTNFVAGLGLALQELTAPNRFGVGVEANVMLANVYDPSGGTGNFSYAPNRRRCPQPLGSWPTSLSTKPFFEGWNAAMKSEVAKYSRVKLLDLHATFAAHGVVTASSTNWFVADCIHPNAAGHDAVRTMFWTALP